VAAGCMVATPATKGGGGGGNDCHQQQPSSFRHYYLSFSLVSDSWRSASKDYVRIAPQWVDLLRFHDFLKSVL
jgi:hypothetical protein